jgi:hypothetical protein
MGVLRHLYRENRLFSHRQFRLAERRAPGPTDG